MIELNSQKVEQQQEQVLPNLHLSSLDMVVVVDLGHVRQSFCLEIDVSRWGEERATAADIDRKRN